MSGTAVLARFFGAGLVVLLCIWLAALSVVAWLVYQARVVALERGERATAAFAAVVEQQTARTFQAINLTLGAVGDAHQLGARPRLNDAGFQRMMSRRLGDIPFVRALFIIGPDGWIIHDTDYPSTPHVSLADRAYFLAHQKDEQHPGAIWPPLESRSGTGWFVPVTRPLGRADGFEGIVVAAIQADYFEAQFRGIGLDASYLIALFHRWGTLVARHPSGGDIGKNFGDRPMFARLAEPQGTFWTAASVIPGEHVVSYRTVEGTPLVLHVSRAKKDLLAEWRRAATGAAVGMLALTIFLAWYIAELLRAQARRRRQRDKRAQAEKLEALGQLTAGIAHDFGNMLQVVAVNAELLSRSTPSGAVPEQALGAIERAVNGATAMLQRLLSFARRRPLAITRVRLDEWLEAAGLLLAQAAGPLVTVHTEIKRPLPEVLCDTGQLDSVMVNLVLNARDAMAGSGRISVRAYPCDNDSGAPRLSAGSPAAFVCLAVQDDGCGMSEQVKRRALEPFYSTKGESGTGLGLSQVYGFMQQVGGDMTIESEPGRGTTVHLFFRAAGPQ